MNKAKNGRKKPKVIKVIWSISHYRVPIFRRLSQNEGMDFIVCAGDNPQAWAGAKIATAADVDQADGINWHNVKSVRIQKPPFRWYEWQPGAIKFVVQQKPDAVICLGNQSFSNMAIRIYCRLKGIPVIEWTQGIVAPEKGLKWFLRKIFLRIPNAFLLYGNFARKFFSEHGFDNERLFVVYNSLDYDEQLRVRESVTKEEVQQLRMGFGVDSQDARLIVHSGRIESSKKLPCLFEAMKKLKSKGRCIKLILIGKGREEDALKECVREMGLQDDIIFYGPCYDEATIGRLFMASHLTVVPGALGLLSMHSLVYGTPILTCCNTAYKHGPEVEAVVEGKTGGYFEDDNVEDLVKKMEYMLYENPCKPRMVEASKKMIAGQVNPIYQEKVIVTALNYVLPADKQIPL